MLSNVNDIDFSFYLEMIYSIIVNDYGYWITNAKIFTANMDHVGLIWTILFTKK